MNARLPAFLMDAADMINIVIGDNEAIVKICGVADFDNDVRTLFSECGELRSEICCKMFGDR
jgi:hypothetical protein